MRRSVDVPRSMPDRVSDAAQRLDDLARAQGRGAPALRSSSGSVLEVVDTASAPTLIHADQGVGARFLNGTLQVVDADGISARDLSARDVAIRDVTSRAVKTSGAIESTGSIGTFGNLAAAGDVNVQGNVIGAWVHSLGNVNADGGVFSGGTITAGLDVTANRSVGAIFNVNAGGDVNDRFGNVRTAPACERHLKNHVRDLDDPLATVQQWRPAIATWADDAARSLRGDAPFAAVYVDEVADTAPEAVYDRGDGTRTTDDRGLIAYAVAAIQQLAAQNRELSARVAVLEEQAGR